LIIVGSEVFNETDVETIVIPRCEVIFNKRASFIYFKSETPVVCPICEVKLSEEISWRYDLTKYCWGKDRIEI
ncbi:MAG: hypothetical protein LBR89_01735, partial [Holosporales bacterium]|nr:hypothetical protein [Holosporales bacterium]